MPWRVESDFCLTKSNSRRGRWTTSQNIITNEGVSGGNFWQQKRCKCQFVQTVDWISLISGPEMRTYRSIRILLNYRFASTVLRNPSIRGSRSYHYWVYLSSFIVIMSVGGECRFVKPLHHFLRFSRSPEAPIQACSPMLFFYIQTSSASSLNWMFGSLSVSLCNNRLLNFFISDIHRGGSAALRTQFSLMQRKIMQDDRVSSRSDRSLGQATFHCVLQ